MKYLTKINTILSYLHVESKETQIHRYIERIGDCQWQGWGGSKMGERGQKVQTFRYKINKSWGCNLQHGDYS